MKNIILINDSLGKGGKERRMLELIKGLISKKLDYNFILIIFSEVVEYDYVYDLPIEFIKIRRKFKFDFMAFRELYKVFKDKRPVLVHSWGSLASVYCVPLKKIFNFKFVNGVIADAPNKKIFFDKYYLMNKITYPFSEIVISNTEAGIKSYNAPPEKSKCVYNGIDLERFKNLEDPQTLSESIFQNDKRFVIGMVAAFEDRKDYMTVVKAGIELSSIIHNISFIFIGDGKNINEVKEAVPLESKDRFFFLGKRDNVESLMQLFDIGVLMTNASIHGEGISNSIIEYMAASKAVIGSIGGGTAEVIIDDTNGFLIEPYSVNSLVEKITYLYNNKSKREKLGENGRAMIESKFSLEIMTEKFVSIYNDCLDSR